VESRCAKNQYHDRLNSDAAGSHRDSVMPSRCRLVDGAKVMNTAAPLDSGTYIVATREQWDKSAKGWHDHGAQIREWLRGSTEMMLDAANVRSGSRVLDVAAGAGDQTLDIAQRVGANGYVLATDLSSNILEFARQNAHRAGYDNIVTKVTDGEGLEVQDGSFDAAICRLGLMFYLDPLKGLREIFRALRPGGRACTLVFSAPEDNPCVALLVNACSRYGAAASDPYQAGGLLSLGTPGLVDELFEQAGFSDVTTTMIAAPMKFPSAKDYLAFIRTSAAPVLELMNKLDDATKEAAWAGVEGQLRKFDTSSGWEGPNKLLLTAGQR
jgi:ubiquinone/menaquinone biosynthesis C-methylase UbiE